MVFPAPLTSNDFATNFQRGLPLTRSAHSQKETSRGYRRRSNQTTDCDGPGFVQTRTRAKPRQHRSSAFGTKHVKYENRTVSSPSSPTPTLHRLWGKGFGETAAGPANPLAVLHLGRRNLGSCCLYLPDDSRHWDIAHVPTRREVRHA